MSLRRRFAVEPCGEPGRRRPVPALAGARSTRPRAGSSMAGIEVSRLIEDHGAVIIVCWHQRIMMTPVDVRPEPGALPQPDLGQSRRAAGGVAAPRFFRLGGDRHRADAQAGAGRHPDARGAARVEAGHLHRDFAHGPRGPGADRQGSPRPVGARGAGAGPVVFTFAGARFWSPGPTWDRLMFPMPFGRLVLLVAALGPAGSPPASPRREGQALRRRTGPFHGRPSPAEADAARQGPRRWPPSSAAISPPQIRRLPPARIASIAQSHHAASASQPRDARRVEAPPDDAGRVAPPPTL